MIKILTVGKLKEKELDYLIADYQHRIEPYHKIVLESVKDLPSSDDDSLNQLVIERESQSLLDKLKPEDFVYLLDLRGQLISSESLAESIQMAFNQSKKTLVFIIGGSLGVSETLRQRANIVWKLSANTFPHGLVRLLVLEQIYRSFRILNHHPYHK